MLNFVRDPFDLVVSLALYSWRGDEAAHGVRLDGPEHRELVARSAGGGWPSTSVLPLLDCSGTAADRACESYSAYLRRLADSPKIPTNPDFLLFLGRSPATGEPLRQANH